MSSPSSTSRYGGRMCSIWFRSQGPLRVPIDILKKCPKLAAALHFRSCSSGPLDSADIKDISPSTGHVIIHYLITERYESLKPTGKTEDERNRSELANAFWVHLTAKGLELPNLQELAQSEMKRLVSKMNLVSVAQTLDETGISLNNNPVLEAHLADQIDLALTQSSNESLNSLTTQLGLPKTVSMFFLEHILETQKSLLDAHGYNDEEASPDLSWAQFEKEFQALVQKFSWINPTYKDSALQREFRVKIVREPQEKTALEDRMLKNGRLNYIDQARLKTLQSNATHRTMVMAECEKDIAATKEEVRQMSKQAEILTRQLIRKKRYESWLQWRKAQNGVLYFEQFICVKGRTDFGEREFNRCQETVQEVTSRGTDESSDDGIMTPRTGSVYESATETPSLLIKDETVRRSRAESERIAKLRLEMENKRIRSRLQEQERLSGVVIDIKG
ncbi:hypothetical protein FAVG1_07969 [Fusarium avenaceum]|nr:hypothetical protein FAVG1_07969 [Fusarium avenaceum]